MPYSINLNLKTQMKMKTTKYILTIALALVCTWSSSFAIDQTYYNSIDGKSGTTLRDALYSIASAGPKNMNYDKLWTAYKTTDVYPADHAKAGKIWDMYGGCTFTYSSDQCGNYDNVCDCYNREHSLPKSWFNEVSPADYDLGHIVPTDGKVNGMRSNYIFGEVGSGAATWGTGKLGNAKSITVENVKGSSTITTTITSTAFEPEDQYKGDFARMYMYMAVRYKHGNSNGVDLAASGDGKKMFNATDANYGLTDYSIALLMKWHRQDPVSKKEIDRNNGMQTVQGNRNPFIDYPDLAEYLWGNHAGETVTLASIDNTFGGEVSSYSISLYRNGETTIINNLSGSYTLPLKSAEDAACTSWAFDGWSATQISETNTKPDYVTTTSSAGIIYAVYAKTTISSAPKRAKKEDVTDDLTRATTGVTSGSTSYSNWSEKTVTSDAVYAGNSAGGNNAIQLRSNNSNSGIVTTASGGKAKKVTVTWHSETAAGRTLNIYGKNSAYSDATDLYSNSTQGTLLGTIVKGTSTELTISGDYEYIGMRSSSGAMYLTSVSIMWSSGSGGGSTTYDSDPDDCHCTGNLATPSVTATPSDGTITLTWDNDLNATNGYTVTISKGVGYTTECGDSEIGAVTLSGSKNTCVITGLVNGLEYTTSVVANATSSICESAADEDTATPVGCESWADPTFTYSTPLTAGSENVTPTIGAGYGTPTFISSNTSVLQVDDEGKVAPISAGTATITAQWPGDGTHCPKDVVSNTITVKGTVVLTFNANYEGADPATATQNFTYGEAQSMTANSFSRTGYTFQGWSSSPSGSKEYDDGASITITTATTLYAVWQVNKHSVTFSQPASGGTFTVNGTSSSPVANVDFGSTVTIVVSPTNSHFTVNTVSVSGASGSVAVSGEGTSRTFAMPDEDVTVSVTMTEETKYTVNWYVNNSATPETNYAGETLVGIANPTIDCNGKAFQGWTATANYSSDDTAPGDLFTDASTKTMPVNGTSYYAVFATESTSGSSKTYNLELDGNNFGSSYNERSSSATANEVGGTGTLSVSFTTTGVMKSTNAGNPIQFRKSGSGAGVLYNTTDLGTINSITYGSGSTNNIATTYKGATVQPTSDGTGGYFKITNGSSVSYLTSITINFTKTTGGGTTYSDYTTSCAAPTEVTVTFHANYEWADPATATQTIPYNTETALTANSFSRTGYTFQGWATTAGGSKEYDNGASVTLTSNTHLYAVWQKNSHDVTFTPAPTGATVTINGQSTSPQSVEYGETVTIVITPDATYDLSSVLATGVSLSGEGNTRTFTMPDADVTVTVIMTPKPTYTIQFFDNGTKVSEQNVVEGQAAVKPADPMGCEGYAFVGWWTAELAETNTASKTWITDFTATTDQDYYAIFEHNEGGGGSPSTESVTFSERYSADTNVEETKIAIGTHTSVTFTKRVGGTTNTQYYTNGTAIRWYGGGTCLVESDADNITSITFTFGSSDGANTISAEGYTEPTWTGSASSVTFTQGGTSGNRRIAGISVTIGGSGTTYYTSTTNCCTDVPSDVVISPSLKGATVRWQAEAATATVRVYSDAEGSELVSAEEGVTSPYTISGLEENTTYYVRILAGGTCATVLHPFTTQQTTVDVVEWQPNGIVIDLIAGDGVSVIIEDQQIINPSDPAHVAEDIFFSKYFEASGSTKLLGLYNGTDHAIDLSELVICSAIQNTTSWSANKASGTSYVVLGDITKLKNQYGDGAGHIMLPPNTEIILYSLKDEDAADYKGEGCMGDYYNWDDLAANIVENWYRIGKTNTSGGSQDDDGHYPMAFSGYQSIGLRRNGSLIDIIGAGTNTTARHGSIKNTTKHTLGNGRVINEPNDNDGYFCEEGMAPPDEGYPDGYTTYLTTNRCLLVRKNTVVSGANSLASNGTTFATLCTEWLGVPVGNDGTGHERSCLSGNLFGYVGNYNYGEYYGEFEEIETLDDLTGYRNEDGTYSIPIPGLDNLACSNLRIKVSEGGEEKASYVYKVPIMVETNTDMTTSEIFSKFNTSICKECDVVILDGATLTKENDTEHTEKNRDEIRNLTIYPGGTLVVPEGEGDYTVNSIQFRVKDDTNAPVAKLSGNLITKNSQVIVTRRINNDRYYFFSLPYDCNVADIRWTDGLTPVKGVEYEIVEYDGETRAIEGSGKGTAAHWKPVANDATLKAGVGYNIAVSSKKPKELVFPMSLGGTNLTTAENNKTATTDIHQYTNAATTINNHNWNLVAHPFVTAFSPYEGDVITAGVLRYANEEWTRQETSSVYITMPTYDTSKKKITYTQKLASSIEQLDPFLAVFVQGAGDGDLTFAQESRKQSAPARYWAARAETQDESIFVGITLSGNELSDETALRIRPDFTDEYQLGYDLEKFITFYTSRPQVYMNTANYKLAFQAVNDSTAAANFLPVGVYCYEAGTYTFALNEQYPLDEVEAVYLYDKTTGQTTNLLYDTYSFTTEKQVYTGKRFALNVIVKRRTPEITTDLPVTESTREAVRKVLIGGHVYILRGGQLYHITGQQL